MKTVCPLESRTLSNFFPTLLNNLWTWLTISFSRIHTPTSELLPQPNEPVAVMSSAPIPTVLDVDGASKGKFTLYVHDDTVTEEEREEEGEWFWWENWERILKMRKGENEKGWYSSQDLTVLNGSVVRLWDARFTRNNAACNVVW